MYPIIPLSLSFSLSLPPSLSPFPSLSPSLSHPPSCSLSLPPSLPFLLYLHSPPSLSLPLPLSLSFALISTLSCLRSPHSYISFVHPHLHSVFTRGVCSHAAVIVWVCV